MDHTRDEIDEHLMNTTLKEVKYKTGAKFNVYTDVQFLREIVEEHNRVRAAHSAEPLTWSQELAEQAQQWAIKIAERGVLLYSELQGIGENIALFPIESLDHFPTAQLVVDSWAAEEQAYDYSKPGWRLACKNFTQLVWKASTEIGVGRAHVPQLNAVVVVAMYKPGGNTNYVGDFDRNVSAIATSNSAH